MATVLSGLTAPAHSTPSALFHDPEAPSLLTLAEQPRSHIMGQLQKAGGAGPAVLRDLAGCTLPAAHTLKHPLLPVESNSLCSAVLAQCLEPLPSGTISREADSTVLTVPRRRERSRGCVRDSLGLNSWGLLLVLTSLGSNLTFWSLDWLRRLLPLLAGDGQGPGLGGWIAKDALFEVEESEVARRAQVSGQLHFASDPVSCGALVIGV